MNDEGKRQLCAAGERACQAAAHPYCWPDTSVCGPEPAPCRRHAECDHQYSGGAPLACVPDALLPRGVQRPRPADASESVAQHTPQHCVPLSAVDGGVWALPLRSQVQFVIDGWSGLAADASLLNQGAYAYRARHAELDAFSPPYVPASPGEALRLVLLSRPDRANALGAAMLLAAVLLGSCC